jgi:hypothetical protein
VTDSLILYHGTCACRLPSLTATGLPAGSLLTQDWEVAHAFARHTVAMEISSARSHAPCVLVWTCPNPEELQPDQVALAAAPEELFHAIELDDDPEEELWHAYADACRATIGNRSLDELREEAASLGTGKISGGECLRVWRSAVWPKPIAWKDITMARAPL